MPSLSSKSLTPFQRHKKKWSNCTRCPLCEKRTHVVLSRGKIPSPILFIGEAPGESEDALGVPFCGPAGALLDHIIEQAIPSHLSYALTNLVACIPLGEDGDKTAEPPKEAIEECSERLQEFLILCKPKLVVLVGKLAEKHADCGDIPSVGILHPAYILRSSITVRDLEVQNCILKISDALEDVGLTQ